LRWSCASLARTLLTTRVALDCNATFGAFKKKCTRCANGRHACVAVEPPMFPLLAACMDARAAHARAQRDESEDEDELRAAALAAGDDLIEGLAAFDRNRNKVTGDRPTPRKRTAGAAQGGLNEDTLLELQSLRRGIFALVEVGKAVSLSFLHSFRASTILTACVAPA
jgi:hypothetical protein